ncbi:MAG TPA: membrane protein insertase YidC [Balneolaceae bacterium]|nr:membrane protein insertase YidC [Balneolaceae bacterium]
MDRNTITGLVLILFVMVAWAWFSMPTEQELKQRQAEQARQDSLIAAQAERQARDSLQVADDEIVEKPSEGQTLQQDDDVDEPSAMGMFSSASVSDTSEVVIETPLYRAVFTNLGAGPSQIILHDYETWDHKPIRMIEDTLQSAYSMGFLTTQNFNVETDELVFEQITPADSLSLKEGETGVLKYALNLGDSKRLVYTYTFKAGTYEIGLDIQFEGLEQAIVGGAVDFGWEPELNATEKTETAEATYASAYVYTGGEMLQLALSEPGREEETYNGRIDWVSTRTKFFTQIIETENPTHSALLIGEQTGPAEQPSTDHHYQSYITTEISPEGSLSFNMYLGPLLYNELKDFHDSAYNMVDVGYSWLRWMSAPLVKYIIIPYFGFIENFMGIGLGIILFAILVKLILYPLTKKSYRSMAAMKELQPKMKEIKEKYDDDPQQQQKATMKLYKEAGVNPLGGCLPNLLQLPILVTLWRFFQNSILIRQQEFLWANDLSAPDYIINLPFSIPFMGDQIAGFVLLMTIAMFFQSKLTGGMGPGGGGGGAAGPNMEALKYIFPLMMLFIFNNFAAGLSLYYLIYNVVSIGQQMLIYRQMDNEKELAKA